MAIPIAAALTLSTQAFSKGVNIAGKGIKTLGAGLAGLAGVAKSAAFAFTALTGAMSALIIRQTMLIGRLVDTSKKLGIGVDFLQKFRYAAEQTGVSADTADMALQRFTRRINEAANGSGEARSSLMQLGIATRDSSGKLRSTESVLYDVADALKNTKSESERVRLAFKFFDSEGVALVNTLSDGAAGLQEYFKSAEALGFVLTQSAADGAKKFDDSLTDLSYLVSGLSSQFTAALAPALDDVTQKFIKFVQETAAAYGGFEGLGNYMKDQFIKIIQTVIRAFVSLYNTTVTIVQKISSTLAQVGMSTEIENLKTAIDDLREESKKGVFDRGFFMVTVGKFKELQDMFGTFEFMDDEAYAKAISYLEKLLAEAEAKSGGGVLNLISEDDLSSMLNWWGQYTEAGKAATAAVAQESKRQMEEIVVTAEPGWVYKLMRTLFPAERIQTFWEQWYDTGDGAVGKLAASMGLVFGEAGLGRLREKLEPLTDVGQILEDGALKAFNAMNDSLVNFIKTGKLSFRDLGNFIKETLIKAFVSKAIMTPLLGALGLGGKANGGVVAAQKPYIVGERGPELFVPNGGGRIMSNQQMQGSGGMAAPTQVTYNINAVDTNSFKQLVARDPEFIYSVTQAGARRLPR